MKILLLAVNARYYHTNIALRYIREYIRHETAETYLEEHTISTPIREILASIEKHSPDAVFISVYIWNSQTVRLLISEIPKICGCLIYLGGPEVSFNPDEWLSLSDRASVILHAGEESSLRIIRGEAGNGRIIHHKNPSFDEIPFPYNDTELKTSEDKILYYESSRGCVMRCSYCLSSSYPSLIEYRNTDRTLTEITMLSKSASRTVKFIDRTFNFDDERACAIISHIASLETSTVFHLELHPEYITDSFIKAAAAAPEGRFRFEIGFQSADISALKNIKRSQNPETSANNIRKLTKIKKFHVHADLIAGLPGENLSSFKKSYNMLFDTDPDCLQLGFLKIIPGTDLSKNKEIHGIENFSFPPYEIIKSDSISFSELRFLHDIDDLTESLFNSRCFVHTISALSKKSSSPFHLFESILHFARQSGFDIKTKNRQSTSRLLYDFAAASGFTPELITDYLRYDFIMSAQTGSFPGFISDKYETIKQTALQRLKKRSEGAVFREDIHPREYAKFIFFMTTSGGFPEVLCRNDEILALYKGEVLRFS